MIGADDHVYWSFRDGDLYPRLLKMDRNLNLLWSRTVGEVLRWPTAMAPYEGGVLLTTPDVAGGFCCGACGNPYPVREVLSAWTGDGELRWTLNYVVPGFSHTAAYAIQAGPDGSFRVAGEAGWAQDNAWAWVAQFDANRTVVFSRTYPDYYSLIQPTACTHYGHWSDLVVRSDGSLVVCGRADSRGYMGNPGNVLDAWIACLAGPAVVAGGGAPERGGGAIQVSGSTGVMPVSPARGESVVFRIRPNLAGRVRIVSYSLLWEEVRVVHDGEVTSGALEARWDGRNASGGLVAAGTYLARIEVPGMKPVIRRIAIGK
jgi:hypothetical protein